MSVWLGGRELSEDGSQSDQVGALSRAGWTNDYDSPEPHIRPLAWYGSTINLNTSKYEIPKSAAQNVLTLSQLFLGRKSGEKYDFQDFLEDVQNLQSLDTVEYAVHRRKVDFSEDELFDLNHYYNNSLTTFEEIVSGVDFPPLRPWYTPEYLTDANPSLIGHPDFSWEGIGTGWFYSKLGGGANLRPNQSAQSRVPLTFDNTYENYMRGDFAVPTLFNGNFDASQAHNASGSESLALLALIGLGGWVPGWSFGAKPGQVNNLIDRHNPPIGTFSPDIYTPGDVPNAAYRLLPTDPPLIHSPFVVPDWGVLRFDLHVPNLQPAFPGETDNPRLRVFLSGENASGTSTDYELTANVLVKDTTTSPRVAERLPGVEIVGDADPFQIEHQGNRIAYGTQGFETFHRN